MRFLTRVSALGVLAFLMVWSAPTAPAGEDKGGGKPSTTGKPAATAARGAKDTTHDLVCKFLDGLRSEDRGVQVASGNALVELAPKAPGEVWTLLEAAADPNPEVARTVRQALYRVGKPGMQALLDAAKGKRPEVRAAAVHVLGQYRQKEESKVVVPVIIRALWDENNLVRRDAAGALRCFPGEAEQVIPALVRALCDPDVATQKNEFSVAALAASSLEHLGPAAQDAVPALLKAFKTSKDERVRHWTVRALGTAGAGNKEAIQALVNVLKNTKAGELRSVAAGALGSMGTKAKPAVSALLDVFNNPAEPTAEAERQLRGNILTSLRGIGPGAEEAVPVLIAVLRDKSMPREERARAAYALGSIGEMAKVARSPLADAAREKDGKVNGAARWALNKLEQ
jgi:HEAT repeat protein